MSETICFLLLNHLVTGDEKLEGADDEKAFRRREAQCRAEIILRVEDSQLPHIVT